MSKGGGVYIITNKNRTVLYIGVTSNIMQRMYQHKRGLLEGFAKKWNCIDLLYFEGHWEITDAIRREKQMKKWKREWKFNLIKVDNQDLIDLSKDWFDENGELKNVDWH